MSVEKKIAELLAESEKLRQQEEQIEDIVEEINEESEEQLDEGAAETIKMKGSAGSEGDNPDNKKNQGTEKPAVTTSKAKDPAPGAAMKEEVVRRI